MSKETNATYYLDKMQIASVRLADTLYGFFSGNHPATTIDNARAISEVLKGIKSYLHRENEIDNTYLEYEDRDPFNYNFKLLSNFTKHADRDTSKLARMDERTAYTALRITTLDYRSLMNELMEKGYIAPDEETAEDWHVTEYGRGNSALILCNLFDHWDQDNFGVNSDAATENFEIMQKLYDITWEKVQHDEETVTDLMNQLGGTMRRLQGCEVDNNEVEAKRKWRDIADDLGLWPAPHHGGLQLSRDKGVDFEPFIRPSAES